MKKNINDRFNRRLDFSSIQLSILFMALFYNASAQLEFKIEALPGIGLGAEYRLGERMAFSISGMYSPKITSSQNAQAFNQTASARIKYNQSNLFGTAILKGYINKTARTEVFLGPYYRIWRQRESISNRSQWTDAQY